MNCVVFVYGMMIDNESKEELNVLSGVSSIREKTITNKKTEDECVGVSHLMMDETLRQIRESKLRSEELRKRLEEVKKEKDEIKYDNDNMEVLHKKCVEAKSEETKVLRRLYLLLKQLKSSLKSECLLRVIEVVSQKGSIEVTKETVERLSPFNSEMIVELLEEYLKWSVCLK